MGVISSVVANLRRKRVKPLDLEWCLPTDKDSLCCNQATLVAVSVCNKFQLLVKLAVHLKFLMRFPSNPCLKMILSLQLRCSMVVTPSSAVSQVPYKLSSRVSITTATPVYAMVSSSLASAIARQPLTELSTCQRGTAEHVMVVPLARNRSGQTSGSKVCGSLRIMLFIYQSLLLQEHQ